MLFTLWNDENQTLQVANSGARFQGGHDRFDDETIIVLKVREPKIKPQTTKEPI